MNSNEKGFSTPLALTVIFSLCIIALSFCMVTSATEKQINSYDKAVKNKKEADSIIFNIEEKMQSLKYLPSDINGYEISSLISSVCKYDFKVSDVSTGINKNFTDKAILNSDAFKEFIDSNTENIFTQFNWINPKFSDRTVLEQFSNDFKDNDTFPVINFLPPLNIFFMKHSFIKAVLDFYDIKDSEKKTEIIEENLNSETTIKEIAEILGININSRLFDLVGTKTVFWKVCFETESLEVYAVFAAIPEKDNQKKIEKYILVKKEITSKGGML